MSSRHLEALSAARRVVTAYAIDARALTPITEGLINLTWRIDTKSGAEFVLQRLHGVFAPEVNLNLARVTGHLAARGKLTPQLIATPGGEWWVQEAGATWRLLTYIEGCSFATLPDLEHARLAGRVLGEFHRALEDFADPLPHRRDPVHQPDRHFTALANSLRAAPAHPLHAAVTTLAAEIARHFSALPAVALAPPRLVHGDPKLSNLRFGAAARGHCMVDLDTVGYAPLVFELGDAFRSWCNPQPEDGAVAGFDLALFTAAIDSYARATTGYISEPEINSIVTATEIITLELAARFAADAIVEAYFGWDPGRFASRGDHNLARARNQLQAARSLHAQAREAETSVRRAFRIDVNSLC